MNQDSVCGCPPNIHVEFCRFQQTMEAVAMTIPPNTPPAVSPERIVAVALVQGTQVYQMPAPARHHDLIREWFKIHQKPANGEQGFVDSNGQYWSRRQAMYVARAAGQLIPREGQQGEHGDLFSEDVW